MKKKYQTILRRAWCVILSCIAAVSSMAQGNHEGLQLLTGKHWDVTGRVGWMDRMYRHSPNMSNLGMTAVVGVNYWLKGVPEDGDLDEKEFLKFSVGYAMTTRHVDHSRPERHSWRISFIPCKVTKVTMGKWISYCSGGTGLYLDYAFSDMNRYDPVPSGISSVDYRRTVVGIQFELTWMLFDDFGIYAEYGQALNDRFSGKRENFISTGFAFNF